MSNRRWVILTGLVVLGIGCDTPVGPQPAPLLDDRDGLTVVTSVSGIAELTSHVLWHGSVRPETASVTFWATYGRSEHIAVTYSGRTESFLEFRMPRYALRALPDGTALGPGDSVQISIEIDPDRHEVRFAPSGLQFNFFNPPVLTMWYTHANPDFDSDGDIDRDDEAARHSLGMWWQAESGAPWYSWITIHDRDDRWITSLLRHFSNYTLSW